MWQEVVLRERQGQEAHTRAPREHSTSTRALRDKSSTKPEILHLGLLVGKHPISVTGSKIPLSIGTGWGYHLPAILIQDYRMDNRSSSKRAPRAGGTYEGAKGQQHIERERQGVVWAS